MMAYYYAQFVGRDSYITHILFISWLRVVRQYHIVVIHVGERMVEIVENQNIGYVSPLSNRYGSTTMRSIFSNNSRHKTWRKLWIELAYVEQMLGLDITNDQIHEMINAYYDDIDYDMVAKFEAECKHDVMAHLKEFCTKCPKAEPIIHLGATSCYITDNADILIMNDALDVINIKLKKLTDSITHFSKFYAELPTMAYTHLQPAQPTTVGKRGCMWLQDFTLDMTQLKNLDIPILGCNGATGTQASFLKLLDGNESAVSELNKLLAVRLDTSANKYLTISGQTYTRKIDSIVLDVLSGIAQSAHKMCNDIRLLQGMHEVCESFSDKQVGSSAMAYKQNPITCENVCSLSRHVISLTMTSKMNACTQWLERSLDDSANRRLVIPEAFLLTDHILDQCIKIIDGLVVNENIINQHIKDNIPFVVMESIIMKATKSGISRQEAHGRIRDLSAKAMEHMLAGCGNNLLELIKDDEVLGNIDIDMNIKDLTGMASKQVYDYISRHEKN